jgi:hypothetical protein
MVVTPLKKFGIHRLPPQHQLAARLMTLSKYASSLGLQVQGVVARESSPQG